MHGGHERRRPVVVVRRAGELRVQVPAVQVADLDGGLNVGLSVRVRLARRQGHALPHGPVVPQPPDRGRGLACNRKQRTASETCVGESAT